MTKVAILGFGTVGQSVAKALQMLAVPGVELTHIYNRDVARKRASAAAQYAGADVVWTESIDEVLESDVDVVAELVGGMSPAGDWIERALKAGKSVVTANKQLIAYRGPELARLAAQHGGQLLHGAAVAGGVPVIPGMLQGLSGDSIRRISGILNGTCNFILSKMEAGAPYAEVLAEAQRLGYAEADPTADVGGFDARAKLCILARVAMHAELDPEQVATQTIGAIDAVDFAYAKELGCTIRQVSRAQVEGDGMYARGRSDAGAAAVADGVVAWDAEYGGVDGQNGRRCGLQRPRRGRRCDGGRGDERPAGGGAGCARGADAGSRETGDGRLGGAALSAIYRRRQAGDRVGNLGCAEQGGRQYRFAAAAARVPEAPAAVCGDDRADAELDDCRGGGLNRGNGLHAGTAAGAGDAGGG